MSDIKYLPLNSNPSLDDWLPTQRDDSSDATLRLKVRDLPITVDTTGLQNQINQKAEEVHSHQIADIYQLTDTLENKANAFHNHSISNVNGLQTALDSKADSATFTNTVSVLELAIQSVGFTYDQTAVPSNPVIGNTWRERKSSGMILRDWEYDGIDWLSIETFNTSQPNNSGANRFVLAASSSTAVDTFFQDLSTAIYLSKDAKGIYFGNTCLHITVNGNSSDLNNYWRLRQYYIQTGTNTLLPGELFTTELLGFRWYERWLEHEYKVYRDTFVNTGLTGMRTYIKSIGSPSQLLFSASTAYRIIR